MIGGVFIGLSLLTIGLASAEQVLLKCHLRKQSGREYDKIFRLDVAKGTVNNLPATFTDDEIIWSPSVDKGVQTDTLNRRTLQFREENPETGQYVEGICSIGNKKQI